MYNLLSQNNLVRWRVSLLFKL